MRRQQPSQLLTPLNPWVGRIERDGFHHEHDDTAKARPWLGLPPSGRACTSSSRPTAPRPAARLSAT
jgi:hypothetical protein